MFLTAKERRRRWLQRIVKWTAMAVIAFIIEVAMALLLCRL